MRLALVCSLVGVIATVGGCGGEKSHVPEDLDRAIDRVDAELAASEPDGDAVCEALQEVMGGLSRWQEVARGNQTVMTESFLRKLDGLTIPCQQGEGEEIDVARISEGFGPWRDDLRKKNEMKSGWGKLVLWVLIPAVVFAFIVYAKRRFYEA